MAVNVSPRQFGPRLVTALRSTLDSTGVAASDVWLELTETTVMDDVDASVVVLDRLRSLGVKISLDDFGTGQSSLAHLRRLPIDELKIDRSFVHGLGVNAVDTAIVASVIGLAHAMGCNVTAEGVENASQLEHLRNLGCDSVQGYLLARPLSPHDMAQYLAADAAGQSFAPRDLVARLDAAARRRREVITGTPSVDAPLSQVLSAAQTGAVSAPGPVVPVEGDFSERQLEIIERLLRGERVPTIARGLYLSQSTVRNHLSAIFRKLGVHSQEELLGTLRKRSLSA
jgi:predicted signal transduction protein with EAL and GGDEF domain/DNA-binding CsgD family transcriptional regulator